MTVIEELIPLADAHQEADEYVSGSYWTGSKGCSVGCSVEDMKRLGKLNGVGHGDHAALARATDVPEMLWRLANNIFEGLPTKDRSAWTPAFLRAVSKATKLNSAPARIMARCAEKLAEEAIRADVRETCKIVAALWRRRADGKDPSEKEWDAARKQADATREQAYATREQAYATREQAYATWKQAEAAWEQAEAAWEQAYAARKQADAARKQADATREQADATREQADAAWKRFWLWMRDVTLEEIARP